MRLQRRAALAAWALLTACAPASPADPGDYEAALGVISGDDVRRHMERLASDEFEGREAGGEGHRLAVDYVVQAFARAGLESFDSLPGYRQPVPLLESRLVPGSATLALAGGGRSLDLEFGVDFVSPAGFDERPQRVTAPLVFAGYGIRAPGYQHDDFRGLDVRGRILVLLAGAPPGFEADQRAFHSSTTDKRARAADLGASGILWVRTPDDEQRLPWTRLLETARDRGEMRWLDGSGRPRDAQLGIAVEATLSPESAERLFDLAGYELASVLERHRAGLVSAPRMPLEVTATLTRKSTLRRLVSDNVVGWVRGSDAGLADQYVLYTAHLDHLGTRRGGDGDTVYNGAYDNAAGVAVLLEVARAVCSSAAPGRSMIFALVTAEEKGLRGSDFLAHDPPVPIRRIVANINVDMPFLGFPIADVEGLGVDHSTLRAALERAANHLGLAVTPDPRPELVRLIRSDQFSFVRQGVPGFNLKPGSTSTDSAVDGAALRGEFLRNHYHSPSDDLALPFSSEGAGRFARVVLLTGQLVADDPRAPRWNDGDFFGLRFSRIDEAAAE